MRKLELETDEVSANDSPGGQDPLPPPVHVAEEMVVQQESHAVTTPPTNERNNRPAVLTATPPSLRRTVNQALQVAQPQQGSGDVRGSTIKSEHLDVVLKNLWQCPNNGKLRQLTDGQFKLECLSTFVHTTHFDSKPASKSKINKVFQVVDAMWSLEDRKKFCEHQFSDLDALSCVSRLCLCVKDIIHLMRDEDKQKLTP